MGNILREFIFAIVFVFVISNIFYFFFDAPLTKLLRKIILGDDKKEELQISPGTSNANQKKVE